MIVFNYKIQMWIAAGKGQDGKAKREARSTDSRDGKDQHTGRNTEADSRQKLRQKAGLLEPADSSASLVSDSRLMAMNKHMLYFVPVFLPTLSKRYVQE
jgi:hypothetical protein